MVSRKDCLEALTGLLLADLLHPRTLQNSRSRHLHTLFLAVSSLCRSVETEIRSFSKTEKRSYSLFFMSSKVFGNFLVQVLKYLIPHLSPILCPLHTDARTAALSGSSVLRVLRLLLLHPAPAGTGTHAHMPSPAHTVRTAPYPPAPSAASAGHHCRPPPSRRTHSRERASAGPATTTALSEVRRGEPSCRRDRGAPAT